jgi:hypothetical protein
LTTLTITITFTDLAAYPRIENDGGKYKIASIAIGSPIGYTKESTGKNIWYIANKAHEHAKVSGKQFNTKSHFVNGIRYLVVTRVL